MKERNDMSGTKMADVDGNELAIGDRVQIAPQATKWGWVVVGEGAFGRIQVDISGNVTNFARVSVIKLSGVDDEQTAALNLTDGRLYCPSCGKRECNLNDPPDVGVDEWECPHCLTYFNVPAGTVLTLGEQDNDDNDDDPCGARAPAILTRERWA